MVGLEIFLAADKGHKKGIGHFVKFVCFWDEVLKKAAKYLLDCEASGGATIDCARALDYASAVQQLLHPLEWSLSSSSPFQLLRRQTRFLEPVSIFSLLGLFGVINSFRNIHWSVVRLMIQF